MKKKKIPALLALGFAVAIFSAPPASASKSRDPRILPNPEDYAIRIPALEKPPAIDGTLDNPEWATALVLDSFTQYEPVEGAPPTERTVAYIGYDPRYLYIAVRCYDSNPRGIRACLVQRDMVQGDDEVTIYLDTFNDKKRAFVFKVNPCGVQTDGIFTETRRMGRGMGFDRVDKSWDTYFRSAATIDEKGYTVEMAIPFKSLRFPNSPEQVWGLQIMRTIPRKNEEIYWYPRSRSINGFLLQTGRLHIPGDIEKGRNIEIMPVLTGSQTPGEPFGAQAGLNLKYGITSDMTADIALNPDFSQVEADMPQVDVNQRFALYFPEKRPFFLEGKDFFDTPLEVLYTRKIVQPQWGAKLSGKMGRTTLGFLSVLDKNPPVVEIPGVDPYAEIEPSRAFFNVLRMRQDLYAESFLGFIATGKDMGPDGSPISTEFNRVAGVDGQFKLGRYNRLSFQALTSKSRAEDRTTDYVPAWHVGLNSQSRHLQITANWTSIHPEFEAAGGFFRRKDIHSLHTRVGYSFLPQTPHIISVTPSVSYRRIYDYSGMLTDDEITVSLFASGWRQSFFRIYYEDGFEKYKGVDFRTRQFRANLFSDPLAWIRGHVSFSFGDGIYYSDNPYLGWNTSKSVRLTLQPRSNIALSYNIQNSEFTMGRGGERVYAVNIVSQRIGWQMSRPLSLRLITDYNDYYRQIFLSGLVSYEINPGTVFHLGIDDSRSRDEQGMFRSGGRYYFIKFSYWWRV